MRNAASTSFPSVIIGYPDKSNLRERAFIFAYSTKYHLLSVMVESQWQEWLTSIHNQEGERNTGEF